MKTLLKKHFGYEEFLPHQEEIIKNVLNKKDTLVIMPTGGGKSLCYQLPAIKLDGLTLVISPLIALMKDQVDILKSNGIEAAFINSTLSPYEITCIEKDTQSGEIKLLYIAPERLPLDGFKEFLKSLKVSLIAIDEAHCISEWGHNFRPDYRNLSHLKEYYPEAPMIALTATATQKVQDDIVEQLRLKSPKKYIASFDRKNLSLLVYPKKDAYEKLLTLINKHKGESIIVYCFSRKETENIAQDLTEDGHKALPYHAGLDSDTRKHNQEQFIKDEVDIMVATIAFGMGIDKPDVRLVVHNTFPKTLEGYYQEIGRAGRDGLPSECVTLYSYGDKRKHEYFLNEIIDENERERAERKLKEVIQYFENDICRRKQVLKYFGENYTPENCKACDICISPRETFDGTEIAQKILSCVLKTNQRFGKKYITDILRGKETEQVLKNRHNTLSVFGIVDDFSADQIKDIITSLISRELLQTREGEYPTIYVTKKGIDFLKKKASIELPKLRKDIEGLRATQKRKEDLDYDYALFEKLRHLRKEIAYSQGVPPFVIFGDRALQEMAYYRPDSQETFARISGVGAKKLATLGDTFLRVIKEHGLPAREIPNRISRSQGRIRKSRIIGNERYQKTASLIEQKKSLKEIAKSRALTEGTIINHIEKLVEAGVNIDIEHLRPKKEIEEEIEEAFKVCGNEILSPVYNHLQEKYPYETIRLVKLFKTM